MTTTSFAPRFDLETMFTPAAEQAGGTCFALVKSGPPVAAEEVESHVDAVEVTVRWGSQILSVSHLANGKSFHVGDGADLALPEDVLGASRAPIVVARGGGTYVVVPRGATGSVSTRAGAETFASMIGRNALPASTDLPGALELALVHGMNVVLELGATRSDGTRGEPITFEIGTVRAGKVAPIGFLGALAGGASGFIALSFVGHAAIVASLALFMPAMAPDDSDAIDRDQILMMQKLITASAEREAERPKDQGPSEAQSGGGSTGDAHQGESGAAGTSKPVTTQGRMSFKGNDAKPALSPKQERELASTFGLVGLLQASALVDPNAHASPWGTAAAGSDAVSTQGDMFSPSIGDAFGNGIGLTGTGEGGGGKGTGIGLGGPPGTIGGGGGGTGAWGFGPGDKGGMGVGHGRGTGDHVVKAASMRPEPTTLGGGRIPADVIQRIVRQNFGRFRNCYETGLRSNPSLSGRIATKFVIGRDGAVAQALDGGSDLPDQNVVACVVRSFNSLSFPAPEGGIATVVYPISFTPGE